MGSMNFALVEAGAQAGTFSASSLTANGRSCRISLALTETAPAKLSANPTPVSLAASVRTASPVRPFPRTVPYQRSVRRCWSARCSAFEVTHSRGGISGVGLHIGVVVALFNDIVTKKLLEGALGTFERHGVDPENVKVFWVPGSFEIPVVTQRLAKSGKFSCILCIGAVVRGSTTHYDAVANSAASGILSVSVDTGVPCIFGVLTCETMEQALDRAGGKLGNKGAEAAVTAIEMANLVRDL